MESSSSPENQNLTPSVDDKTGKVRVRTKIRKKRDPLDEKVKKYRRKREHATVKRQKVERFMLAIAGIVVGIFLINIILAMTSEVNLNWLTSIIVSVGVIGFLIWSVLKLKEILVIRNYQKYRRKQKLRDAQKSV